MPQLSIAAFAKAFTSLAGRKRPRDEVDEADDYDSDEIKVSSVRVRPALQNIAPSQAQNKRRRVLDCVLIPREKRILKQSILTNTTLPSSRPLSNACNGSRSTSTRTRTAKPKPVNDDTSDDELLAPTRKPTVKKSIPKDKYVEDSDFDEAISEDGSDAFSADASDSTTSGTSLDQSSDEDEKPTRSKAKRISTANRTANEPSPATTGAKNKAAKGTTKMMKSLVSRGTGVGRGLDLNLPPLHAIEDMFDDMTTKAFRSGLEKALQYFRGKQLRVATMCSGTESPILALEMIRDSVQRMSDHNLAIEHAFSAEIVPFKQAYIERNFNPPLIFRDITELTEAVKDEAPMATTAYGSKVEVPTDIHMLIAGTSCVDFSNLNKHKKTLEDDGESAKTWEAVFAFCSTYKPPVVLIENIRGAEWDRMQNEYRSIGYETAGVHVDTKNYYLPQTRQRGYMVCFDKAGLNASKTSSGEEWQSLMSKLQRYCSSPASSFFLPTNALSTQDQGVTDDARREIDWARCAERHVRYRQEKRLGNQRPLTHWQESGSMIVPENGNASWYHNQVERVLDLMDCSMLRKANAEIYDVRFKTRIWDVSQNVDMQEDSAPFGIANCITPTGHIVTSDGGRALSAHEVLKLQGIPLSKISLTTETPRELQDLAGNAMSSTVVGSAILSALVAGYKSIRRFSKSNQESLVRPVASAVISRSEELISTEIRYDQNFADVSYLLNIAKRTIRRCFCEGGSNVTKKDLQRCCDCGHTTCTACGGNPQHNYRHNQSLSKGRILPQDAEADIRSRLPLQIKFANMTQTIECLRKQADSTKMAESYCNIVEEAVNEVFSLHSFKRASHLTITFQSQSGGSYLDLLLREDYAQWQLFAHAPKDLAVNDSLRATLERPIARSRILHSLFNEEWTWRLPSMVEASLTIHGHGGEAPTWWARIGLPDFRDHKQPRYLTVEGGHDTSLMPLQGTYEYLPRCGTACDSLYRRIMNGSSSQEPMFLFLDPTRVGNPTDDCFIFSRDAERLDYHETRSVVAQVQAPWRPWDRGQTERAVLVRVNSEYCESSCSGALQPLPTTLSFTVPAHLDLAGQVHQCGQSVELVSCAKGDLASASPFRWSSVGLQDTDFFAQNAWLFEAIRRQLSTDKWNTLELGPPDQKCTACAPKKPELKWKLSTDGEMIQPYEDSSSAAEYERAIKSRPAALLIETNSSGDSQTNAFSVRIGANFASMIHRVRAQLPWDSHDVTYCWKLRTHTSLSNNYTFKPFVLRPLSRILPYTGKLNVKIELFPNQQKSLAWMIQQESGNGREFHIEQALEEKIDQLGWALEMRAQAPVKIRGGICADHPGYGKTIISLALVQAQWQDKGSRAILRELSERQDDHAPGLLPSTATVIICPWTLVDQWAEEACNKLGFGIGTDVLPVKKITDLDKLTLDQLSRAKLIIISIAILSSEQYIDRLAAFAGVPGPAAAKGRAFEHWLRYALDIIPENLEVLQHSGQSQLRDHAEESYSRNINSDQFKAAVPSRRLRGKDYVAAQTKSKQSQIKFAAPRKLDTSLVGKPLLHIFYLNRVICDEFHNYGSQEMAIVRALKKDKIWGLSGTPPTGDFYDVNKMGQLLDIDLPMGAYSREVMKQKNIKHLNKEMTDFERFDSMRQPLSQTILGLTNELLQDFLNMFVTRNVMDFTMDFHDHLVPVSLDLDHRAVYSELSQYLNSIEMRLKKGSKSKTTDREERLDKAIATSNSAEEALSKLATYFDRGDIVTDSSEAGLDHLIFRRKTETLERQAGLRTAVREAEKHEPVVFEQWRQGRLHLDVLGDQETVDIVTKLCTTSEKESMIIAATKLRSGDKHDRSRGLTSTVNALVTRLLVSKRSLRFVENLNRMLVPRNGQYCANADCQSGSRELDVGLSAFCGHVVCETCRQQNKERGDWQCQNIDCHAEVSDHDMIWRSKIQDLESSKKGSYGIKIDAAVQLLQQIRNRGDQAVLFVQYDKQLDQVNQALQQHDIPAAFADESIEEFKLNSDITVMVLNASDETATGLNLQNANHVVFLSPLLRDQQYSYDATMAQAIGRVRRHGQKKKIHVYRIIALDTIDVDILEHREKRTNAITEYSAPTIRPPSSPEFLAHVTGEMKPERTQLVKENGVFSLRPQSWLVKCGADEDAVELDKIRNQDGSRGIVHEQRVKMKGRVMGWENFSSLIKFSRAFTEDDD